jgi:hypothetical protein
MPAIIRGFCMKSPRRKLLGILTVIVYSFVVPGTVNAQWVQTNGLGSGYRISSFAACGTNIFAGSR